MRTDHPSGRKTEAPAKGEPPRRISIIIPAFNEESWISEALHRINDAATAFEAKGWETEWIVCDNNSTDATAEISRQTGAKVVFEPVNQIARARNRGAQAASGDWLIFIDADSRPSGELFQDVAAWIAGGGCVAGGCTLRMDPNPGWAAILVRIWNGISRLKTWGAGSFIFCERRLFEKVGGFDESFYAGEEIELFERLKRQARLENQRLVILSRHPLVTSARKLSLYSSRELVGTFGRFLRHPRTMLTDRKACRIWYDGRR